jgi:hypothetical protein
MPVAFLNSRFIRKENLMRENYEIIHDPDENIPEEEERKPDLQLSGQERRWYALGALRSALLIGCVYLIGIAIVIVLMLWAWN